VDGCGSYGIRHIYNQLFELRTIAISFLCRPYSETLLEEVRRRRMNSDPRNVVNEDSLELFTR